MTVDVATPLAVTGPVPEIEQLAANAEPTEIVNEELSTVCEVVPPEPEVSALVALNVLLPERSMLRPLPVKSATPATAFMDVVPPSEPVPVCKVSVMLAVASAPVVTILFWASRIFTIG